MQLEIMIHPVLGFPTCHSEVSNIGLRIIFPQVSLRIIFPIEVDLPQ